MDNENTTTIKNYNRPIFKIISNNNNNTSSNEICGQYRDRPIFNIISSNVNSNNSTSQYDMPNQVNNIPRFNIITPIKYNNFGWYVYILKSLSFNLSTYVGKTNDLERRLRQHNGDLKCGGAKRTKRNRPWVYFCYISGFPNETSALQFEWRMHHPPSESYNRRRNRSKTKNKIKNKNSIILKGIPRRVKNLRDVLSLNKWTSNSPLSSSIILKIHWKEEGYNMNLPNVLETYEI